jgi:hypothetical protein
MHDILTKELLVKRRVNQAEGILSGLYRGKADDAGVFGGEADVIRLANGQKLESLVVASSERWENTEGYAKHWGRIEALLKTVKNQIERRVNISEFPADYYTLVDMIRMDITRRRLEALDFTGELTQEITNAAFSRSVRLDEFIPFAGAFAEMKATGDQVPMVQQKTGETGMVSMHIYGLGHERSLEDELYNTSIFSLEKVNAAVARAFTGLRNDLSLGQLVALTLAGGWAPSQQVAAQSGGANATYDQNLYLTLKEALRVLYGLRDPQTGQEIVAPRVVLVVGGNVIEWDIQRIMRGQLNKPNSEISNLESLPIDQIWKYKGDTLYVGPKTVSYPGVPANTAYLLVPGPAGSPAFTLVKRGLTQEVGRGDVLQLARDKRAWYFVQTSYGEEFIGSSSQVLGLGAGFGYCVEITLPTDTIET